MGIDEEIYVMRDNRPISHIWFTAGYIQLQLEDGKVEYEEVELINTGWMGYWISGANLLKIIDNLDETETPPIVIEELEKFIKENPVLPTDKVLYRVEGE